MMNTPQDSTPGTSPSTASNKSLFRNIRTKTTTVDRRRKGVEHSGSSSNAPKQRSLGEHRGSGGGDDVLEVLGVHRTFVDGVATFDGGETETGPAEE